LHAIPVNNKKRTCQVNKNEMEFVLSCTLFRTADDVGIMFNITLNAFIWYEIQHRIIGRMKHGACIHTSKGNNMSVPCDYLYNQTVSGYSEAFIL
jgi:hypothetical protein